MLFVTGDTHIPHDITKLNTKSFPQQKFLSKLDHVMICGDFGAVWSPDNPTDKWWLNWLEQRSFTTLFVDGNHENFDMLDAMPVEIWNSGKIHRIRDGIHHLMRGQVFHLDSLRVFTMGGGASGDKYLRTRGKNWWPREMPSQDEYDEAWRNLEKASFQVDIILTHTAPTSIIKDIRPRAGEEFLTDFLEQVKQKVRYRKWFFGHVHRDMDLDDRHSAIFNRVVEI